MRPAIKDDGLEYYEYVLLYTNDAVAISENGEYVLREQIGKYFELNEESIEHPVIYLGRRLCKVELENSFKAWFLGST